MTFRGKVLVFQKSTFVPSVAITNFEECKIKIINKGDF
nr:MAG TPA: hypothetical protein [Caudoviricetes sp.]